ncbi:MAG: hypothetical protein NC120_05320 [Ruminococcus sp.]|nr:hypothetical protein [Ruminococcus sp.]
MKKFAAALLAAVMSLSVFTACSKEEEAAEEYNGVLSKIRLGMPMSSVLNYNSGCEIYYESDTEVWCVNTDADLMEIRERIPEGDQFYYAEDALLTYRFRYDEADDKNYLEGYQEEVVCMMSRQDAMDYYDAKAERLKTKYSPGEDAVKSTVTGAEGVDLNLDYVTTMTMPTFEVIFTLELTYDTVNGVDDYYGTYYSIEVNELKNKTPVDVSETSK